VKRKLTGIVFAALLFSGCGSTANTTSTPVASQQTPTTESHAPSAAEAERAAIEKRVKSMCEHRRALGSVETMPECERLQLETELTLAKSKRSLTEGKKLDAELRSAKTDQRLAAEANKLKHEEAEEKRRSQTVQPLGHRYPSAAQQAFLAGCKAEEKSSSVCRCWLRKVELRDSLPELEALSYGITHGARIPSGIKTDLEACTISA
jgi:PBP1b-binding outer membrane lipoprotein LpoB